MRREKKYVLGTTLLTRPQKLIRATLRRTEQSERIRDLVGATLWNSGGVMRLIKVEPSLPEPAEIRRARVREERLSRLEPATHPPRSNLIVGSEAERDDEHHRDVSQGSAGPPGPRLQMPTRSAN